MNASLFQWLNRFVRAGITLCWCAAAFAVWTQRERARPAVDYYALWRDAGWQRPDPLPRWTGEFRRMISPGLVEVSDNNNRKWRFSLRGLATVNPDDPTHAATNRWFLRQTLTNLSQELARSRIEFGTISITADRPGVGFLYRQGRLTHADWVRAGWYRLRAEECRILPLREQYELRLADREAQRKHVGVWALPGNSMRSEP